MTIKYSAFFPASSAYGVVGTALSATRNLNVGSWVDLANEYNFSIGDIYQWEGASYIVNIAHTKLGSSPDFTKASLFAETGNTSAIVTIYKRHPAQTQNMDHRAWRYKITAGMGDFATASEIEFLDTPTGTDQTNTGTPFANGYWPLFDDPLGVGYAPDKAFDNNINTMWATNEDADTGQAYIGVDWGAGVKKAINSATWRSRNDSNWSTQMPLSLNVEWSDNMTDWYLAWTVPSPVWTGPNQVQKFDNPNYIPNTPELPSASTTYDFITGALTGLTNGWTTTIPAGTDPLYVSTAIAVSNDATDSIPYTEWSAPKVIVTSGNYIETIYKRQYSQPTTPTETTPTGWSTTPPAGVETLWRSVATKNASGGLVSGWSIPISDTSYIPRGSYLSDTLYYLNNTVLYQGGTYLAIQNNFQNQPPSGTSESNAYWSVMASPGPAGTPASPPSGFVATINLTNSTGVVNLRSVANANGYTGASDATITFKVPNGVTITGLNGTGIGIDTGSWPSGYTIALTLIVESGGIVFGGGGNATGSINGGDGIYLRVNMSGGITINSGGILRRGAGAGGNGGNRNQSSYDVETGSYIITTYYGGTGGGGFPNGTGNNNGTTSAGGTGGAGEGAGAGAGGNGGGPTTDATAGANATGNTLNGSSNGSGTAAGANGYAVRKNGFTATVTNNGTMTGTAG